jgi:hypothetical protein
MTTKNSLNVHQRLAAAMEEVTYIQKDKKAGMRYSIVSHDVVTAKVRPALLKHGIVYYPCAIQWVQNGNRTEVQLDVRFVNIENPEDFFDVPSLGYGVDNQDKGPGKGISYAVKYALLKALGLETGDDPDQDQDAEHVSEIQIKITRWANDVKTSLDACKTIKDVDEVRDAEDSSIKENWPIDQATCQVVGTYFEQAKTRINEGEK